MKKRYIVFLLISMFIFAGNVIAATVNLPESIVGNTSVDYNGSLDYQWVKYEDVDTEKILGYKREIAKLENEIRTLRDQIKQYQDEIDFYNNSLTDLSNELAAAINIKDDIEAELNILLAEYNNYMNNLIPTARNAYQVEYNKTREYTSRISTLLRDNRNLASTIAEYDNPNKHKENNMTRFQDEVFSRGLEKFEKDVKANNPEHNEYLDDPYRKIIEDITYTIEFNNQNLNYINSSNSFKEDFTYLSYENYNNSNGTVDFNNNTVQYYVNQFSYSYKSTISYRIKTTTVRHITEYEKRYDYATNTSEFVETNKYDETRDNYSSYMTYISTGELDDPVDEPTDEKTQVRNNEDELLELKAKYDNIRVLYNELIRLENEARALEPQISSKQQQLYNAEQTINSINNRGLEIADIKEELKESERLIHTKENEISILQMKITEELYKNSPVDSEWTSGADGISMPSEEGHYILWVKADNKLSKQEYDLKYVPASDVVDGVYVGGNNDDDSGNGGNGGSGTGGTGGSGSGGTGGSGSGETGGSGTGGTGGSGTGGTGGSGSGGTGESGSGGTGGSGSGGTGGSGTGGTGGSGTGGTGGSGTGGTGGSGTGGTGGSGTGSGGSGTGGNPGEGYVLVAVISKTEEYQDPEDLDGKLDDKVNSENNNNNNKPSNGGNSTGNSDGSQEENSSGIKHPEHVSNPKTGVEDYILPGVMILLIGTTIVISVRNKDLFRRI